jgi:hypothetical protein
MRLYRRLRFGRPIVVVSGLPRSGTSMAMKMLQAGGLEVMTDGLRAADDSNPDGYFELEQVKHLETETDRRWLKAARGRAIKIISFLLPFVPETNQYTVIFMRRPLDQVIASQNVMLARRGEAVGDIGDDKLKELYEEHLKRVGRVLASRRCFETLNVEFGRVLADPAAEAAKIAAFLRRPLNVERMAAVANPRLSHHGINGVGGDGSPDYVRPGG